MRGWETTQTGGQRHCWWTTPSGSVLKRTLPRVPWNSTWARLARMAEGVALPAAATAGSHRLQAADDLRQGASEQQPGEADTQLGQSAVEDGGSAGPVEVGPHDRDHLLEAAAVQEVGIDAPAVGLGRRQPEDPGR